MKANQLGIVKYLADDVPAFDPNHPDPPTAWGLSAGDIIPQPKAKIH
jgi:hypothetical protein